MQDRAPMIRRPTTARGSQGGARPMEHTPADAVQRLLDLEAIKQLKARYFRLMDCKQWGEMRGLFTDDATIEAAVRFGGPDDFIARVSATLDPCRTVHHGHMPEIVFTGPDSARG